MEKVSNDCPTLKIFDSSFVGKLMYINDISWNDQLDKDMLIISPGASDWLREGYTSISWGKWWVQGGMLWSLWDLSDLAGPEPHPLQRGMGCVQPR